MTEMSSVSSVSSASEMSSADTGTAATDKDAKKINPVKAATIVILVILVVILLLLILFDSSSSDAAHGGSGGGGDGGGDDGSGGFSGGGHKKSGTTKPTTPAPTTRTTPVPIKRPVAFIFCTVGAFSESSTVVFDSMLCDYFVYTHVLPYKGDILSYDSGLSWELFKKRATAYRDKLNYFGYPNVTNSSSVKLQHYGYSFDAEDLTFLGRELSGVSSKVTGLYKDHGLLTAGMAYYDRPDGSADSQLSTIQSLLGTIDSMLLKAQDLNTTILKTTFLGVKFAGMTASATNDASALKEYLGIGKIDLLILLTHLVDVPSDPNCKILQLSRYTGDALDAMEPPSMERLLTNIDKLKGAPFRVAFSLTFSVFLYKPSGGLKDTTKYGDACMHSFFDDRSELCSVPDANITENADPMSSSAYYKNTAGGIFMVFETTNATRLKTSKASAEARLKGVDLTWAAYDVHRDVMNCGVGVTKGRALERLSVVNDTVVADYAVKPDDDRK